MLGLEAPAWLAIGVIVAIAGALLCDVARPDLIFLGGLGVLLLADVITPEDAFAGFSNTAVLTLGALFVVAAGVQQTEALSVLDHVLFGRSVRLQGPDGAELGLTVEPIAVPGKVALYLENPDAGDNVGTEGGDTIGLRIATPETGKSLYYIPGCAALDAPLRARLEGAPLVLFDGTLYEDQEMVAGGLGQKTGQRMGHMNISGPEGTLAGFEALGVGRRIFIHINNSNPILLEDSPERAAVAAAGWEVAYDGQEIVL